MNRDDILRMAREVHDGVVFMPEDLERFAKLVAAAEREACAKVCESAIDSWRQYYCEALTSCAAAIRARGQE